MVRIGWWRRLFYFIKPLAPRYVQIALRRHYVTSRLKKVSDVWPIDESAGRSVQGWKGWPLGRKFAFVLTHDIEGSRGVERCRRVAQFERDLGLVSSFNFVPERYPLPAHVREDLAARGFEIGVHDLRHDGKLFGSEAEFCRQVEIINRYLRQWHAVGFRAGSMFHNLEWMHRMDIEYDASTFDTDPFEPQPDGVGTIYPIWIENRQRNRGYVELPYTLPQDMTVFVLLQHSDTQLWQRKLDWVAERGGMVLLNAHPDYMHWTGDKKRIDEYPFDLLLEFLELVTRRYSGQYWNALPRDVARYWKSSMAGRRDLVLQPDAV